MTKQNLRLNKSCTRLWNPDYDVFLFYFVSNKVIEY